MSASEGLQVLVIFLLEGALLALALAGTFWTEWVAGGVLGSVLWRGASVRYVRLVSAGFLAAVTVLIAFSIYSLATDGSWLRGGARSYGISELFNWR